MIVVDTNVVSAFMTSAPPPSVLTWLNAQEAENLYLTTISVAEIRYGLRVMPEGKRRRLLEARFQQFIATAFEARILAFDEKAAHQYAEIKGHRRKIGRPMSDLDGQIAAIASIRGFAIATRNVKDFDNCGLNLINPFEP